MLQLLLELRGDIDKASKLPELRGFKSEAIIPTRGWCGWCDIAALRCELWAPGPFAQKLVLVPQAVPKRECLIAACRTSC